MVDRIDPIASLLRTQFAKSRPSVSCIPKRVIAIHWPIAHSVLLSADGRVMSMKNAEALADRQSVGTMSIVPGFSQELNAVDE